MKHSDSLTTLLAGLLLSVSEVAFAASDDMPGLSHSAAPGHHAQVPLTDALVEKVEKSAGTVTLSAGALPNGMPAMTMDYRLKDPSWLRQLKEGQKIRFATEEVSGVWTVVRFEGASR